MEESGGRIGKERGEAEGGQSRIDERKGGRRACGGKGGEQKGEKKREGG